MVFTIGHSTRPLSQFVGLLNQYRVTMLIDVRTIPHSRHNPQFNIETLPSSLAAQGIKYRHMPDLGGLRKPQADSLNTGWRNLFFRGFADYIATAEFEKALQNVTTLVSEQTICLMCAEAVPWRCHRSLIGDALTVRGLDVIDIISEESAHLHRLTPFATVSGGRIVYPPAPETVEAASPARLA